MGNVFFMSEIIRPFQYDKLKSYKRWVHSHKPKKILHGKNHHKQNQKTWQMGKHLQFTVKSKFSYKSMKKRTQSRKMDKGYE